MYYFIFKCKLFFWNLYVVWMCYLYLFVCYLGVFGDVDGDGKFDVIVNLVLVGVICDEYVNFVKMKFDIDIYKINFDDVIKN